MYTVIYCQSTKSIKKDCVSLGHWHNTKKASCRVIPGSPFLMASACEAPPNGGADEESGQMAGFLHRDQIGQMAGLVGLALWPDFSRCRG
jgi:hypothetical protein